MFRRFWRKGGAILPTSALRSDVVPARPANETHGVLQPPKPRKPMLFIGAIIASFFVIPPCALTLVVGYAAAVAGLAIALPLAAVVLAVVASVLVYGQLTLPEGSTYLGVLLLMFRLVYFTPSERTARASMKPFLLGSKKRLRLNQLEFALNLSVPSYADEEFMPAGSADGLAARLADVVERNARYLPSSSTMTRFQPGEDPVAYMMSQISDIYPVVTDAWPDKQSDVALARLCVSGLGAHRLERHAPSGGYVVRCNALAELSVKPGLSSYGGDCILDKGFRVLGIEKRGGLSGNDGKPGEVTMYTPASAEWEYVKFVFRSSLFTLVTLVDHLYGMHLLEANSAVLAVRRSLSTAHPLRRFLSPFIYQTVTVNDNACNNLVAKNSMGPRNFALDESGLMLAWASAPSLIKLPGLEGRVHLDYEKLYQTRLRPAGLDTKYHRSRLRLWRALRAFADEYLRAYYPSEAALRADAEVADFVSAYVVLVAHGLLATSDRLSEVHGAKDDASYWHHVVSVITHIMIAVTADHEQVGSVQVYAQDVSWTAFSWPEGEACGTKELSLLQGGLMCFTSTPMPALMKRAGRQDDDWSFLFPDTGKDAKAHAAAAYERLQANLRQISADADADEASFLADPAGRAPGEWPIVAHNPRYMETSVSV